MLSWAHGEGQKNLNYLTFWKPVPSSRVQEKEASCIGESKIKMREKNIDWTSKRIERLNIIGSSVGWGLVALSMVLEIVFKGTLDLTGDGDIGMIFGIWFMGQLSYAYKREQQVRLHRLEAGGLLKKKP